MAVRIVFVDSNGAYAEKLASWISKFMPYQFSIEILTSADSFSAWVTGGGKADLAAVSIDLWKDVAAQMPPVGTLILDDGSHLEIASDVPRIFKFRPAEEIVRDILSICADTLPKMHVREEGFPKITLVSYLDGAEILGCVAPAIAYLFGSKGRRVIYLSLERNQITDLYFTGENTRGLNEMLYYSKTNRDNLALRLETCLSKDSNYNIDFLKSPPGILVPGEIEEGDIDRLLAAIAGKNAYEEVVLVADAAPDDNYVHILKKADRIILVSTSADGSKIRLGKLMEGLKKNGFDPDSASGRLRLVIIMISETNESTEHLPGIKKAAIHPNVAVRGVCGWLPAEHDLSLLDEILIDIPDRRESS